MNEFMIFWMVMVMMTQRQGKVDSFIIFTDKLDNKLYQDWCDRKPVNID